MPLTISSRFGARAILLSCAAALLSATATNAAPIMTIDIGGAGSSANLGVGNTVTVSLYGDEIPAGTDNKGLFGFGFAILYDQTVLTSSAATAGLLWTGTGFVTTHNNPGDVGMTANRFFETDGPSGDDILLASIDFTAVSAGLTSLTVGYYTGAGDNALFDGSSLDSSPSFFQSGSINVIPEPQTALLLCIGLASLAARQRRAITALV